MQKLFLLFFLFIGFQVEAQNSLTATIVDSSGIALPGATTILLSADSVMAGFATSDESGKIVIKDVQMGSYILDIKFLGFEPRVEAVKFEESRNLDLGNIVLYPEAVEISEILVEGERIPIRINGDTIEYDAKAFETSPNADVEELLKQLPGIEVEPDGTVRAQGKVVENVLVDGKPFFGKDPKLATKNLPADAVDKVEVFDKSSDFAAFAGVDDGKEEKTINLTLDEDHKSHTFGNATIGGGTESTYKGKLTLNRFDERSQMSVLGGLNNINEQSFSFMDYIDMMGGLDQLISNGGGRIEINDGDLPAGFLSGASSDQGLFNLGNGGVNYNHEFNKKLSLTSNYFYSYLKNTQNGESLSKHLVNDQSIFSSEALRTSSVNQSHSLALNVNYDLDSFNTVSIQTNNNLVFGNTLQSTSGNTTLDGTELQNSSQRSTDFISNGWTGSATVNYRHRFAKPGRTLTAMLAGRKRLSSDRNIGFSNQQFYLDTIVENSLNQRQMNNGDLTEYTAKVSFSEKLAKRLLFQSYIEYKDVKEETTRSVFDILSGVEFPNSVLSRLTKQRFDYGETGVQLRYVRKALKMTVGVAGRYLQQKGLSEPGSHLVENSYLNLLPLARVNWNVSNASSLMFSYRTNIVPPAVSDLQEVEDVSDPLNVFKGNPDLKPEFQHSANVNYNFFDRFSNISLYGNVGTELMTNTIIYSRAVDKLFRQTIQPVNSSQSFRFNSLGSISLPLRFIKSRVTIKGRFNLGTEPMLVNGVESKADRRSKSVGLTLESKGKKILGYRIGGRLRWNNATFSNSSVQQSLFNQRAFAEVNLKLCKDVRLGSKMTYNRFVNNLSDGAQDVPIWEANVSWQFLKGKKAALKLSVFDILNKNQGISQNGDANYYQVSRLDTLGRYFMISFTYYIKGLK